MVNSPVVSSIRSKQTGHVGNSKSDGVGGGAGFVDRLVATGAEDEDAATEVVVEIGDVG